MAMVCEYYLSMHEVYNLKLLLFISKAKSGTKISKHCFKN